MLLGKTIKFYRKDKNLTQSALAELIGVSTQAVSKWETDAGMPDITQLVPVARVLGVSTDELLGHTDMNFLQEAESIRRRIGSGINLITDTIYAQSLYEQASAFFDKHPDVSDIAVTALECYVALYAVGQTDMDKDAFLDTCERYAAAICRYETAADRMHKTHYLMARAYALCGEERKAENSLNNLPAVFGFRDYWEAEIAYADGDYARSLVCVKRSFAQIARFTARCIRLAGRNVREQGGADAAEVGLALDEYMLRLIDAFLSGGDWLPHRQIFQKTALLAGLVQQCCARGEREKAEDYMRRLEETKEAYLASVREVERRQALMFLKDDLDGAHNTTEEKINGRIRMARQALAT